MTTWNIFTKDSSVKAERVDGELALTAAGDLMVMDTSTGQGIPKVFYAARYWQKAEKAPIQGALS